MGLEMVELIMDLEDEFDITIRDSDLRAVRTVGELHDVVLALVRKEGKDAIRQRPDVDRHVWERVVALSAALSDVDATTIKRETDYLRDLGYG